MKELLKQVKLLFMSRTEREIYQNAKARQERRQQAREHNRAVATQRSYNFAR